VFFQKGAIRKGAAGGGGENRQNGMGAVALSRFLQFEYILAIL
jgi:hypothetical protein